MNKKTNFKGLEVSDMNFKRRRTKCSKEIKNSCGTRDCSIEVYKLGDDTIYAGGLCPKGNTSFTGKIAPNYVLIYQNFLNSHLKKYSIDLNEKTGNPRILIPRSMTFLNEKGVFYTSLYHYLGFDVCVSPESNEKISDLGKSNSHSEFCYPLMLAHGHVVFLKEKMNPEDKLLLVDVISTDNKTYKFCPYVAAAGNTIMGNLDLRKEEVLLPVIRFGDDNYPLDDAIYKDLKRVFRERFSKEQVKEAIEKALKSNEEFLDEVYGKGKEILERLKKKGEKIFVGIGRGYTILDDKASSRVHELFASNGLHFIPSYFFKPENYDIDSVVGNMYWYQGRKMLESNLFSIKNNLFPVRLTNFNCGPDSMLHYHEEALMDEDDRPWLVLETDGHNSNAQFGTRIRAHDRVVQKYLPNKKIKKEKIKRKNDFENRVVGVAYMGDNSHVISAALRFGGLKAEVMPTATPRSMALAKKIVNTNTCRPFSFQVGDNLAWLESLKKRGIDANKEATILIPHARGPCRFGQYSIILREIFNEHGFGGVLIISPSSDQAYRDVGISIKKIKQMTLAIYKGVVANDLLENALLRYRPYESNPGDSYKIYKESHEQLLELIEKNVSLRVLRKFLEKKAKAFEKIPKKDEKRRPLVLMNGEIFVRSHPDANQDSVKLLEENGLEVILEPLSCWVNYVNKNLFHKSSEKKDLISMGSSFLGKKFMGHIYKKLSAPFKEQLKRRESHDPFHLILDLEEDLKFHHAIEGESGISIGEANAFINGDMEIDGIYHVGPLGCMQETMATSRIQALIQKKRETSQDAKSKLIPFMDAVFGDSPSPNLESQIAIFAENCRLKRDLREEEK